MACVNNVLYYIDLNLKRSNEEKLIELGKAWFEEKEIIESKQLLLDFCQAELSVINKNLADDVKKIRIDSVNRPKVDVIFKDIIKIFECFSAHDKKLEIKAQNPECIPKCNPECVDLVSAVTRLDEITKENKEIRSDYEKLKGENVILNNKIVKIENEFQAILEKLSNLQIAHVSPRSTLVPTSRSRPADLTVTTSASRELTDASTNSGIITDAVLHDTIGIAGAKINETNAVEHINDYVPAVIIETTESMTHTQNVAATVTDPSISNSIPVTPTGVPANIAEATSGQDKDTAVDSDNNNNDNNTINAPSTRPKSKGSIKHERNLASTKQAISATIEAVRSGKSEEEIQEIAMTTATETCKSYAEMLAKKRSNVQTNNGNNVRPVAGAVDQPWQTQNKYNKAKKSHIGQYKKGKVVAPDISIAAERPKYLDSKCLVVSRVNRDTSKSQFQNYINSIAGKNIKILNCRNLAKDYSRWRTVAIELCDEDYSILSNQDLWDSELRIKDFVGRRFWHNKASIMTANERKSSVYQSWQVQN